MHTHTHTHQPTHSPLAHTRTQIPPLATVAGKAIPVHLFVGEFALLTPEVLQQWLEKRFLLHIWDDEDAAE